MPFKLCVGYDFHPVGQGLFSTGFLCGEYDDRPRFRWVYDCGTISAQRYVRQALDHFEDEVPGVGTENGKLDLVTLSHFDEDHISGIVRLLQRVSVGTLLLPYMPLWQRLFVAFIERADRDPNLIQFYINPVAYLVGLPDVNIERIIFVVGGSTPPPDEGPPPDIVGDPPVFPDGRRPWKMEIVPSQKRQRLDQAEDDFIERETLNASGTDPNSGANTVVEFMQPGSSLRVEACWEFVPYNDAHVMRRPCETFEADVTTKRRDLLAKPSVADLDRLLGELKDVYDNCYGHSSKERNVISLFLYSGAFPANSQPHWLWFLDCSIDDARPPRDEPTQPRHGLLYTGDGYLNIQKRPIWLDRLQELLNTLGDNRMRHLLCLQVMHHGGLYNWQVGLAGRLDPIVSVFSSDPFDRRYHHPNLRVWQDFWPYGRVQVNKTQGASFRGITVRS